MKKVLIYVLLFLVFGARGQNVSDTIKWQNFDQVREMFYKKNKPILIYLYTDNCDSCQMMQKECFDNNEVARYINFYFYPIKFNAHSYDTVIFFNGEKFIHHPGHQFHSLITVFIKDSLSFPALVMFNKYGQGQVFYGFRDRDHIFPILIYYAEEIYTTANYPDFEKVYFKTYPPGLTQIFSRLNIHWKNLEDLDSLLKRSKKLIFIDVYDRLRVSTTIMRMQVYNNPVIANYMNKHFYPITVEARWQDTLVFNNEKYGPSQKYPFHNLAIKLLNGRMKFPAFLIFDENYNLLNKEQIFLLPEDFYRLITYFGDEYYKEMDFKTYLQKYNDQLQTDIEKIRAYYRK